MGIDGLTIHHLSRELHTLLAGGRVDKVTQSSKDFFQLHIYANRQKIQVLLSTMPDAARVSLSKEQYEYMQTPQNFCMLLRKHLLNATIDRIEQVNYERIIAIHFTCSSEFTVKQKVLYCEIMGRYSNLILVQDGYILGALKSLPLSLDSKRNLLTGAKYALPPAQHKLSAYTLQKLPERFFSFVSTLLDIQQNTIAANEIPENRQIMQIQSSQKLFAKFLFEEIAGLSMQSSQELAKFLIADLSVNSNNLANNNEQRQNDRQNKEQNLFTQLQQSPEFLQLLQEKIRYYMLECPPSPSIAFINESPKYIYPITFQDEPTEKADTPPQLANCTTTTPPTMYIEKNTANPSRQKFDSVLESIEYFFKNVGGLQKFEQKRLQLLQICKAQLKKEQKKLQMLKEQQQNCLELEKMRLFGELITANIYAIKKGDSSCTVINYYIENQEKCVIPLESDLSPSENAQKYYKQYNKQKRTLTATALQIEKVEQEIAYYTANIELLNFAEELEDLLEIETELLELQPKTAQKKQKNASKKTAYRKYCIDGFIVYVGRNNLQNDRLLKESREQDIWLHAQKLTSTHAIIFANRQVVPENVIAKAAEIVGYYSSGRENGKVTIDYCYRKYVKKPPKAKAGFVLYSNFKSILIVPNKNENLSMK